MNGVVYLTPEGKLKLEAELQSLEQTRPELSWELEAISAEGISFDDLDPAYEAVRNDIAMLEGRITQIQDILARGRIISESISHELVSIGSRVQLKIGDGETEEYLVVGSAEANPREGRISNESPVGRAILGRSAGDQVTVRTPDGPMYITIISC
mgnify:FL=1